MTAIDATGAAAPTVSAAPNDTAGPPAGAVRFLGKARPYWRLLWRGAALLMVTLGIYRFWLVTDIRRFLWANTEIAGDGLEYVGTARELLLGFLFAIALLVPVYAGFFLAALDLGAVGQMSGVAAFAALAVLGQFAVFRARRYRLTRTVFRGIRFHQTGSGLRYALMATAWWIVVGLTAGLAYPFAQASLERYKMRHTHYGDLRGGFDAAGWRLFFRGLPLWLLVVAPMLFGLLVAVASVEWEALAAVAARGGPDAMARVEAASPGFAGAIVVAIGAASWAVAAAALLYPAFQAMMLRWWTEGLRFGGLTVASRLRTAQVYGAYLRFLWYSLLLAFVLGVLGFAALAAIGLMAESFGTSQAAELVTTGLLVVGYVTAALAYSAVYQATVKLRLWHLGAESAVLSGVAVLDGVKATGTASSAFGEGLADALNVGGV